MPAFAITGDTALVDDDKVQCPTAAFTKIQDAVNFAANGAIIRVCAGTYDEQVTITKPITLNADNGALVKPTGVSVNSASLSSGNPIAAIILVQATTGVNLRGFIVDGASSGLPASCGANFIGIYYRNASGSVTYDTVRNIKLPAGAEGCQSGQGIFVQSGLGTSNVSVNYVNVHDYQKTGIVGNEVGTTLTVQNSVVTGSGPSSVDHAAAQNGIQIGFGAIGTVQHNVSANHVWAQCVSIAVCEASSTDILIYQSNSVQVSLNTVGRSQTGIYVQANGCYVHDNTVFDSLIFDGIDLIGNNNNAISNIITKSDESGIYIQGNNNAAKTNFIQETPIGIKIVTGSVGTLAANQNNQFFNTLATIADPPASSSNPDAFR
jgi:hypothetical protein